MVPVSRILHRKHPLTMQIPRHIAIIMDGNGRWAQQQGLPRVEGHRRGADVVKRIVEKCAASEIECLTLYCLSCENWKRPAEELDALMQLLRTFLVSEREKMVREKISLRILGSRDGLPSEVLDEIDRTVAATQAATQTEKNLTLALAINYGGRQEILRAVQKLAEQVAEGDLEPRAIDAALFDATLDTAGMPDPDLLIRTAGEYRLSNYLLWQISYAEIFITERCWPEFSVELLDEALIEYSRRKRKFGAIEQ